MADGCRILTGASVFTGETVVYDHAVVIEGDVIADIRPVTSPLPPGTVECLPDGTLLAPGFIDAQINGAGGILFNDAPTVASMLAMAKALCSFGVTGFLPTLITSPYDTMAEACSAAIEAVTVPGSGVLGLHLEGPFLGPERPGIHDPRLIRPPEEADFQLLENTARRLAGRPLLVTLAPETVPVEGIERLARMGVIVSLGHTAASYEQTMCAVAAGARGFTHLFNAMPPLASREPGSVGAALASPNSFCGLIADGIHVHPAVLAASIRAKAPGEMFFVSDAMSPLGTDLSEFTLAERTIYRRDGRLTSTDGVLAGADIDLLASVRNGVVLLGLPLEESLRMVSLYPARFLRLDRQFGRIASGYQANLALLENWREPEELVVSKTWIEGRKDG